MDYIDKPYFELRQDIVLNNEDFPVNDLVDSWITQASAEIDKDLEREFGQGDYTHELSVTDTAKYTEIIFLPNTPITAVSVTANSTRNEFDEVMEDITSVIREPSTGMVKLQKGVVNQKVIASYTGGYATIPLEVQDLCYLIVQRLKIDTELKQELGDDTTTSISSIRVSERSPQGLKQKLGRLDNQIRESKERLGSSMFYGIF